MPSRFPKRLCAFLATLLLLAPGCGEEDVPGEFQPTHHAGIDGRVLDSAGSPIAGVRVSAISDKSGFAYAETKADGRFRMVFGPHMGDEIDRPDDTVTVVLYAVPAKGLHRDSVLASDSVQLTFHPVRIPLVYEQVALTALPLP